MGKVKLSDVRRFVRKVLSEGQMKRNPDPTGRTAYSPASKKLYVEWDDGDKTVVAVYDVTAVDDKATPWLDYDGDKKPDSNPAALTYVETIESFPQGANIVTPESAIASAKAYKSSNPNTDIGSVNMLSRASPALVMAGGNEKLKKAAGGIEKARPDFYKRKTEMRLAASSAAKTATASPAGGPPASAPSAQGGGGEGSARTDAKGSAIKSAVRVKKGEYGFTLKFNNTSRGPITILAYLLKEADGLSLGMTEGKMVMGPKDPGSKAVFLGGIKAQPGEQINVENLFKDPPFSGASKANPGMSYIFLRYYRGSVDNVEDINPSKVAATSLSKLYSEPAK